MKTILLLRHAKSDWDAAGTADHERPLNGRGRKAAALIGRLLARIEEVPDRVLTSSALRARETVRLAAEAGAWRSAVEVVPEFYGGPPGTIVARVQRADDRDATLLLAGHEPNWSALASALAGGGTLRFPTAALARIDLAIESWRAVGPGRGRLVWFVNPRLLIAAGLDRDPQGPAARVQRKRKS